VSGRDLGRQLLTAPEVGRVILTGSFETAALFRSWKPDLPLLGETSGKNAIIVTPSADLDLAVADVVKSAFGNAGQKCSAASLVILVGSVAESERFRRQLADAVTSMKVGWPQDPATLMGPIVEKVQGKLQRGLTQLAEGETWLVEPRQLDTTGRLWSPGVRDGVLPGSEFHLTEYFGPVLGIMQAKDLAEAIGFQRAIDYGLTSGLHSLDSDELAEWLDGVEAGNLYVNRVITGAIVRRQPFGGWKRSGDGPNAKVGGPNTLFVLGDWTPVEAGPAGDLTLGELDPRVAAFIEACQPALGYEDFDRVRRGALSDQAAWETEFGVSRDVSALEVERNVFRYRPAEITVRLAEGGELADLVRVLAAGVRARATMHVSTPVPLQAGVLALATAPNLIQDAVLPIAKVTVEQDAAFHARAAADRPARIRLLGGDVSALAAAVGGAPDVAIWGGPVTAAGRVELLPFLREQAISVTAHRFGNPDRGFIALPV
jgi:RHH-type proline utilization regulon transcriptional repressor/proline dehydrogenase/delta 1-pyrroline-5-carboxylate dehydrogenase